MEGSTRGSSLFTVGFCSISFELFQQLVPVFSIQVDALLHPRDGFIKLTSQVMNSRERIEGVFGSGRG